MPTTRAPNRSVVALAVVVTALTALLRLAVDLRSGGLLGAGSIDDGVYEAASASLLAGRLPYRDFLFLHPPGILLALAPFAALGRIAGDATGFAAARLTGILLGAVNTGLVSVVLRRWGPIAALSGAIVYAASWPVVFAERSALLEPLGCFLLLAALALAAGPPSRRRTIAVGLLTGAAIVVKLTFAVPAIIVLLALRRRAVVAAPVAALVMIVVCLPFLAAAPGAMPQEVLADQFDRRRIVPLIGLRLAAITMPPVVPGVPQRTALAAVLVLAAVVVLVGAATPGARRYAVMAVTEVVLLLASPSFYGHYAVLALLPLAILTGVAVGRLRAALPSPGRRRAATGVAIGLVVVVVAGAWTPGRVRTLATPAAPAGLVAAMRSAHGCVTADAATTLVVAGVLTRDLEEGCAVWPDVTGTQYDPAGRTPGTTPIWPVDDPAFQRRVAAYLRSGRVLALTWKKDGLSPATRATLLAGRLVYAGPGGVVVDPPG